MEYLVIDVGGIAIKYARMDENAAFLEKGETPTPMDSLNSYLEALDAIIRRYRHNIAGIAMCVPGIIDSAKGVCITGGNLRYVENLPLAALLQERYGLRVSLENDARCVALAELWRGNLRNCADGVVVVLGSAVGGVLIKDGRIHKGSHFSAGEFSFIERDGDVTDICNSVGYQNGVLALYRLVEQQTGIPAEKLDGIRIFEMANRGDERVCKAIDLFTGNLARMIYNLQAIYDPELFVVGGAISQQSLLMESLIRNVDYIYDNLPFKAIRARLVPCRFRNASNLIGALYHYLSTANPALFFGRESVGDFRAEG